MPPRSKSSPRGQGNKRLKTYRLDSETLLLMQLLAERQGVTETEVLRLAVRVLATARLHQSTGPVS